MNIIRRNGLITLPSQSGSSTPGVEIGLRRTLNTWSSKTDQER